MRRMKKVAAATLTAMMVASLAMGTTETWARSSKRAAWNNAAAESTDVEMFLNMYDHVPEEPHLYHIYL